jgi:hypothetical protein
MLHTLALQLIPSLLGVAMLLLVWKATTAALDFFRGLLR